MGLPAYATTPFSPPPTSQSVPRWVSYLPLLLLLPIINQTALSPISSYFSPAPQPAFIQQGLAQCSAIKAHPEPTAMSFKERRESDRFVEGTKAVVLRNATIWTGNEGGEEVIRGGWVHLDKGLIVAVGQEKDKIPKGVHSVDLNGDWVTPGIVDMHSHLGVSSSPALKGADDTNSLKDPILPFLRSLDGLNTHDDAFNLSISGGVTTSLILPGSANNIGGQAFVIKLRQTNANTPSSMVLENPFVIDAEHGGIKRTGHIRHMKHACGENIHRVYNNNRFDQAWSFRRAYQEGQRLKNKQDDWCKKGADNTEPFPDDMEYEALADVIRGNVRVNTHCYETVDFDQLIRLTNEFKFPLTAVHHAHEAYLVPDLLKKAYGRTPMAAIFATNARYKRESYRGSEFAPMLLAEEGIDVVMKSDHPVLDSRYLTFEAAQAHYYGLNASLALASVTSTPARGLGKDHRIGYLRSGYDADLVVWDAHPLTLGATPKQTFIDGIPQIAHPTYSPPKPHSLQSAPKSPSFGSEPALHLQSRGQPDLLALLKHEKKHDVVFTNVRQVLWNKEAAGVQEVESGEDGKVVVVRGGKIVCAKRDCLMEHDVKGVEVVDLKNGSIVPGLVSFGSPLGLNDIAGEKSTHDGAAPDPFSVNTDKLLDYLPDRAADGYSATSLDALIAARNGVSKAITAPSTSGGLVNGLSFAFSTSAAHPLEENAILQEVTALHVSISHSPSVSSQIATLRRLLVGNSPDIDGSWAKAAKGELPLVVRVDKADIIARLLLLKAETAPDLNLVIHGGMEAHMLAKELADANVGVILSPARSFPSGWDQRRILPGIPLSEQTPIEALVSAGVLVGLGIPESWEARNTRLEAGWALLTSPSLTLKDAHALVSSNLEKLLGVKPAEDVAARDWVAYEGDMFSFEGKFIASGL